MHCNMLPSLGPLALAAPAGAAADVLQRDPPGEAGPHPRAAVAEGGAPDTRGHGLRHKPRVPGGARCAALPGQGWCSAGAALSASWWLACSQNVPARCRGSSRRTGRAHCNQCPSICINSNLLLLLPLCPALPAVRKRNKGGGITFGRKRRRAVRKDREGDEDDAQFALTRFVPMLQEVLEDAGERRWWWHAGGRALCGRPCAGFPAVCPAGYVLVLQAACWMPAD